MEIYVASFVVIALVIAGMAIGAMCGRGGLRGSCGGSAGACPTCRRCRRTCPARGPTGGR